MKKTILLLLPFFLFSCGATSTKTTVNKTLFEVLIQQSYGGASIQFYEILTEPNEIKMLQNDAKLKNKITTNDILTSNFIILNMGEKLTGGFEIGVEGALETDKNIIVTIKETSPEPDAMVSKVISNPYCVVKINSKKEIIFK
ncbi:protease complex subunit PrcB family protein [uncultured Flavobacterium sp.]|uniref:protease complex subunit PrcB family protein n=1 Tax=uncultured Flavobacterium sp. TaxID=165435 RepID=UPI0030CA42B3